jgi:ferredoxin
MSDLVITIDQGTCCGSGMCASIAPEAFRVQDSGIAEVLHAATELGLDPLLKAAKSCPTLCITLSRDGAEIDLF